MFRSYKQGYKFSGMAKSVKFSNSTGPESVLGLLSRHSKSLSTYLKTSLPDWIESSSSQENIAGWDFSQDQGAMSIRMNLSSET